MTIIRLDNGILPARNGGEIFYRRNGRVTGRQAPSPLIFKSLTNIPFREPPINDQAYEVARVKDSMQQWRNLSAAQKAAWIAVSPWSTGSAYVMQIDQALRRNSLPLDAGVLLPTTGALSVVITAFHFVGLSLRLSCHMILPAPAPPPPITEDEAYSIIYCTPPGQSGKTGKPGRFKCIGRTLGNVLLEPLNLRYRLVFGQNPKSPIRIRLKPVAVYIPAVGPDAAASLPPGI